MSVVQTSTQHRLPKNKSLINLVTLWHSIHMHTNCKKLYNTEGCLLYQPPTYKGHIFKRYTSSTAYTNMSCIHSLELKWMNYQNPDHHCFVHLLHYYLQQKLLKLQLYGTYVITQGEGSMVSVLTVLFLP